MSRRMLKCGAAVTVASHRAWEKQEKWKSVCHIFIENAICYKVRYSTDWTEIDKMLDFS